MPVAEWLGLQTPHGEFLEFVTSRLCLNYRVSLIESDLTLSPRVIPCKLRMISLISVEGFNFCQFITKRFHLGWACGPGRGGVKKRKPETLFPLTEGRYGVPQPVPQIHHCLFTLLSFLSDQVSDGRFQFRRLPP